MDELKSVIAEEYLKLTNRVAFAAKEHGYDLSDKEAFAARLLHMAEHFIDPETGKASAFRSARHAEMIFYSSRPHAVRFP